MGGLIVYAVLLVCITSVMVTLAVTASRRKVCIFAGVVGVLLAFLFLAWTAALYGSSKLLANIAFDLSAKLAFWLPLLVIILTLVAFLAIALYRWQRDTRDLEALRQQVELLTGPPVEPLVPGMQDPGTDEYAQPDTDVL